MRRYLLFLLLAASVVKAQPYKPVLDPLQNTWYYVDNQVPVRLPAETQSPLCSYNFIPYQSYIQYTGSDTVINSLTYKTLYQDQPNNCLFGFVREDTTQRKVYFLDVNASPEIVLYDFSMQVGNTINLNFVNSNFGPYFTSGTYTLDSIVPRVIHHAAGMRRVFYLNCVSCTGNSTLAWIEGIGSTLHFVYPYSLNEAGGLFGSLCYDQANYNFYQLLSCFEHSQKVYYDSCARANAFGNSCFAYADSCNYWNTCGSVEELNSISSFSVSPVPAGDHVMLELEIRKPVQVNVGVFDISGKPVLKNIALGKLNEGLVKKNLDISSLKDGFYFIRCSTPGGTLSRKLVVKH
jgi:hypothetical protein